MRRVCVFCGSSSGVRPAYSQAAREMGTAIARRGWRLVTGGGQVGLMGVVADAAMDVGGEVIGVIPEALAAKEVAHGGLTELRVVGSMHERKALMAELSDAFVALPGGFGTLEELFEVLTWAQLGLHLKPCGLLDVDGYYDPLLALLDHAVQEQFLRPAHRALVIEEREPERLLDRLTVYRPERAEQWIEPDQT